MIIQIDNITMIDTKDVYRVIPVARQPIAGEPNLKEADVWAVHHSGMFDDYVKFRVDLATAEGILKERTKEAL